MKGRKPKPTALKRLTGNPGKRPLNTSEPQPRRALPRAPEYLSDVARREWHRLSRDLYDAGVLTAIDRDALGVYCQALANLAEAEAALQSKGRVISVDGVLKRSPWLAVQTAAIEQIRSFGSEFGMTPASRTRIHIEKPEEEDPFEAFVKQQLGATKS